MDVTDVTAPQPIVEGPPQSRIQFQPAQRSLLQKDVFAIRILLTIAVLFVVISAVVGTVLTVKLLSDLDKITSVNSQLLSGNCDPASMVC